jgi:hypothetical protein
MIEPMEHRHLLREIKTALELAIATRAPWTMVEHLAMSSGLLEALIEVPAKTLLPETMQRAKNALATWRNWEAENAHKGEA